MSAEFTTLFGADGTGKTEIAKAYLDYYDPSEVELVGGSTYKTWLTPEVADMFFGHELSAEQPRKYEEVGVAVYGLANYLRQQGKVVAVDSDSYLKRYVWAMMTAESMDEYEDYAGRYTEFILDTIGSDVGPDLGVAMYPHEPTDQDIPKIAEQIMERLTGRGVVSKWDPTNEKAVADNLRACAYVIEHYMKDPLQPNSPSKLIEVHNPMVEAEEVKGRISEIAHQIYVENNEKDTTYGS